MVIPRNLRHLGAAWLVGATAAQNQVVVHTPPGGAAALALAIDRARLESVVGTVAGDDTVLVICRDPRRATKLASELVARSGAATER